MTNRESLQLAAFERTLTLLGNNNSIIQNITKLTETKTALNTAINAIRVINVEEEKGSGGAIGEFNAARIRLIDYTIAVQGALIAYATGENNHAMLEAANFSVSRLKQSSHESLYDKCKVIHELALPNKVKLNSDYQLPTTSIDQLATALETYKLALPDKGLAKKENVANTKKRKEAFELASGIMEKLDKFMLMFRSTQPVFYNAYLDASHIGGRQHKKPNNKTSVTGQVVDFETHEAIAEAKIAVVLQPSETYSDADGKFSIEIPVAGEITLKAEKAGYKLFEENLIVEEGESVTLLVEMEKGG
jgi:hypothetical protein